jgi:hypothetical protein
MRSSRNLNSVMILAVVLAAFAVTGRAADPGQPGSFASDTAGSGQKAGSVLFFNAYTSDPTSPMTQDTKFAITNTNMSAGVALHLFFIESAEGLTADFVVCLTPNQTVTYNTSDLDPGTEGYIVVVAINGSGAPIVFNHLIGDEYIKFPSGHQAVLPAVAVRAKVAPTVTPVDVVAELNFNGSMYEQLPSLLAIDNIPSRASNNDTMVIINQPGGDLAVKANSIGSVFGLLYNDTENGYSFSLTSVRSQLKFSFNNSTPRTAPRFTTVVPDGRSGWVRMNGLSNAPLLGAMINFNSGSSGVPTAYNGGHNLHHLRLSSSITIRVPVYPASCAR